MAADAQAAVERPGAVLEEGGPLACHAGLEVRLALAGGEGRPLEERHDLVEQAGVVRHVEVVDGGVR